MDVLIAGSHVDRPAVLSTAAIMTMNLRPLLCVTVSEETRSGWPNSRDSVDLSSQAAKVHFRNPVKPYKTRCLWPDN